MNGNQHEPAIALLERLLSLSEKNPERTRSASASPSYDQLTTALMLERFQAQIDTAERVGAVRIQMGKRERRHLIERISVVDTVALARHLGLTPAKAKAHEAQAALAPLVPEAEPHIAAVLEEIIGRWSRSESAFRLPPGDILNAKEFLTLLAAISKDEARGLDARTFSLRATRDTKAFERHALRIATVLARQFGDATMDSSLIWTRIGLERFSHPIHVRGPIVVEDECGVLVHGRASPFTSIHREMLTRLRLIGQPPYILTIENYASFNRYVREMSDGSLIVYSGGFPSASVVEFLQLVLGLLTPIVPFFHWGDIDPGGLRIFRFLEEALPRPPEPHLMDRALAEAHGNPMFPDGTLATIARSDSAVAGLANWLAFGDDPKHLEQEALDPEQPIAIGAGSSAVHSD